MNMIETKYEVTIFPIGKGLYSAINTSSENNDSLVEEECIKTRTVSSSGIRDRKDRDSDNKKTQQKTAPPVQSEMQDENSIATGSITVIKMMGKGHGKDKLIKAYFNDKEASVHRFQHCITMIQQKAELLRLVERKHIVESA